MSSDINVQTFSGKVNITSNLLVGSSHLFVDTINNRVQAEKTKTYELQQKVEILEMSHGALIQRIEALENL